MRTEDIRYDLIGTVGVLNESTAAGLKLPYQHEHHHPSI